MRSYYKSGWLPDIPDRRDFLYSAIRPVIRLPKKVDLSSFCSRVEDQGGLGSCTAQALAGNLEFLDKKTDGAYTDVSRLFVYYNERLLMGSVEYDSGASLRVGIKTLSNHGACGEKPSGRTSSPASPASRRQNATPKPKATGSFRITVSAALMRCWPAWPKGTRLSLGSRCMKAFRRLPWRAQASSPCPGRRENTRGPRGHGRRL